MKLTGTIERVVYKNEKSGFTWFLLHTKDYVNGKNAMNNICCQGQIPNYNEGFPLEVEGEYDYEKKKFIISSYKEANISGKVMQDYLATIPGIGKTLSQKLAQVEDIFNICKRHDAIEYLSALGLSAENSKSIVDTIKSSVEKRELMTYVYKHGGNYRDVNKLYAKYDNKALTELKNNPYKIGGEINLSLAVLDTMAKENSINYINPKRVNYVIEKAIKSISRGGNCYATVKEVINSINRILKKGSFEQAPNDTFITGRLSSNNYLYLEQGEIIKVFPKNLRNAEINIAKNIKRLSDTAISLPYSDALIDYVEGLLGGMKLAKQQRESFHLLRKTGIKILTGGPGTGKTTTINGLIKAYEKMCPDKTVKLAAPTGRAAQRITESTGRYAETIHKLIELKPYENDVICKTRDNPIEADVIILDEMSMADVEIFNLFLNAVKDGTLIFLVGDVNQLPSVGAGDVLSDLIKSECLEICQLTEVYRQKGDSPIVSNAYAINDGKYELTENDFFKIIRFNNQEDMINCIKDVLVQSYKSNQPFYTQILSPTHKGLAGTDNINKEIQEIINPKDGRKELPFGNVKFRERDKIIMLSNNYAKGYCNGDIGVVLEIKKDSMIVDIQGEEIEVTRDLLEDVDLAYANTIHKSQGSEYPITIISLPAEPECMLKRNLLYTAVTRAKTKVIIVCEKNSLYTSIKTSDKGQRRTRLKERIQEEIKCQ